MNWIICSKPRPTPTSSTTVICGIAKREPLLDRISAGVMASVSGMRSVTRAPLPARELSETEPPIDWMFSRTTSMPTPRPETLVTPVRGREARREDVFEQLAVGEFGNIGLGEQPHRQGFGVDARDVEPAAVVGDVDDDLAGVIGRAHRDDAGLVLADAGALGGRLDAVIGAIADDMGQRRANELDHLPVELGVGAFRVTTIFLADRGRDRAPAAAASRTAVRPAACARSSPHPAGRR